MKYYFLASFIFLFVQLNAQTSLIAHKSHSGSFAAYTFDVTSNFGKIYMPPSKISKPVVIEEERFEYFEVLNDSIVIKLTTDSRQDLKSVDTLSNNQRLPLEKFKSEYKKKSEIEKQQLVTPQKGEMIRNEPTIEYQSPENRKQNSPSFLLIFFAVSAVGMLVVRLFRSSELPSTPIQ